MNQFQSSLNFPVQPPRFSSLPIQASQYPLHLSHHKNFLPHINSLYLPISSHLGNSPEPTKRIRHTQQDYTETPFKLEEIPSRFQYADMLKNSQHLSRDNQDVRSLYLAQQLIDNKENTRNKGLADVQACLVNTGDSKIHNLNSDVLIPPLNNYGPQQSGPAFASKVSEPFANDLQRLQYEAQQMMLQQLLRQKHEYAIQQEVLQQVEKHQHELEVFMQQQMTQQTQLKINQFNQNVNLRDINAHHQLNLLKLATFEENQDFGRNSLKSDNFKLELLNFEEKSEKVSNDSRLEIPVLKIEDDYQLYKTQDSSCGSRKDSPYQEKIKTKEKVVKPKRKRSQHYPCDYFGVLGKNLPGRATEEPRRKNKWQKMLQALRPDIVCEEEPVKANKIEIIDERPAEEVKPIKAGKPIELPQHMQDDSLINYDHLIRVTITNDPAYMEADKTNSDFVVINKEIKERTMDEQIEKTRVGDRYQAVIPEYNENEPRITRRHPEMVWGPGTIRENEMRRYFAELCRMLKCDMINEDRALKLLRRKRYKKDKVLINISKNEKFYASYLIVRNFVDGNTENDVP